MIKMLIFRIIYVIYTIRIELIRPNRYLLRICFKPQVHYSPISSKIKTKIRLISLQVSSPLKHLLRRKKTCCIWHFVHYIQRHCQHTKIRQVQRCRGLHHLHVAHPWDTLRWHQVGFQAPLRLRRFQLERPLFGPWRSNFTPSGFQLPATAQQASRLLDIYMFIFICHSKLMSRRILSNPTAVAAFEVVDDSFVQ